MSSISNFFQPLYDLMDGVDSVSLSITKGDSGILSISILPTSKIAKDKALNRISAVNLSGTPTDLDAEFFSTISTPLVVAGGLYKNIAEFEASVETARVKSEMEKGKQDREKKQQEQEKKAKEENDKKVIQAIEDANKLLNEKEYEEALKVLNEIQQKKLKLSNKSESALSEAITKVKQQNPQAQLFN